MISKIKNLFKSKEVKEYINISGHEFTVLEPTKLPILRDTAFNLESYSRDWGIDKPDIRLYLKEILLEANVNSVDSASLVNRIKNISNLVSVLDTAIAEDYQYKPYLKAACMIILIKGEDPNKLDAKFISQKLKLCQDYPEIEAFFLRTIKTLQLSMVKSFDMSKITNWYPSKNLKIMESTIYKRIGKTIYTNDFS